MRTLNVGLVLGDVINTYFAMFPILIVAAAIIYLPLAFISALGPGVAWVAPILSFFGFFWVTAVVTLVVRSRNTSESSENMSLPRESLSFIVPLLGASVIYLVSIGGILIAGIAAVLIAGLFGLPLLLAALVAVCIFFMRWSLLAPVIVIEKSDVFDAFGRSGDLVKGSGWQVFIVFAILGIVSAIVDGLCSAIGSAVGGFAGDVVGPLLSGLVTTPVFALAAATVFFQLRDLKARTART